MKGYVKVFSMAIASFFFSVLAMAQLPVEIFAGHKKATADIMFFRYFKKKEGQLSDWLFFNRNRAGIDYAMTTTSGLPQFGFTEAVSYNRKKWKGFAPVAVVQIMNKGVYPKAGIQFSNIHSNVTIFSWLVCETLKDPSIDWFFLGRYTPGLTGKLNLFLQIELLNTLLSGQENYFNFIQRLRLGVQSTRCQFGLGADFTAAGRNTFTATQNTGLFLRHEF